jgi:hypothetical protein
MKIKNQAVFWFTEWFLTVFSVYRLIFSVFFSKNLKI